MSRPRLPSPGLTFIVLTLFGLLGFALMPRVRSAVGVSDSGRWFLDSHAVLAALDAKRAGIDPAGPNPLDVFHRSHKYSDWWLALAVTGLGRGDNFVVGGAWALAFLAALFSSIRPRDHGEALWSALLAISPPVVLGIHRANNDLVIFALLTVSLAALRSPATARATIAAVALALAAGLKFYPAVGVAMFLPGATTRRGRWILAGALLATALSFAAVASQMVRGTFHVEPEIHMFGARIWAMSLGLPEKAGAILSVGLFAGVVAAVAWRTRRSPLSLENDDDTRMLALAAALLVGCFLTGVSYGYRLIFALWLAPWAWSRRRDHRAARLGVWLLPIFLWRDALLCLATELFFPHLTPAHYAAILDRWWAFTEPITWVVVIALGVWLVRAALAVRRSWQP